MGSNNGFHKFPKIKRIGHDDNSGILEGGHIVVKEKYDGANCRFTWDEDEERLVFGSKNVEYWNEKDIDKSFEHAIEYVRDIIDKNLLRDIQNEAEERVVIFGEAMHSHTLDYGEPDSSGNVTTWEDVPNFIAFDIFIDEERLYWDEARPLLNDLNLPIAQTIYEGPAEEYDLPDADDMVESEYRDGYAEGIIIRNEDTGQAAKHRATEFKERHGSQTVSDPDGYEPSDGVNLARQFTTEARVLKMIHKYEDRGETIGMEIMETLWEDVYDDVIDEEYDTLLKGNYTIDTKEFRSEVASITARVLQTYLERPEGSVLNE